MIVSGLSRQMASKRKRRYQKEKNNFAIVVCFTHPKYGMTCNALLLQNTSRCGNSWQQLLAVGCSIWEVAQVGNWWAEVGADGGVFIAFCQGFCRFCHGFIANGEGPAPWWKPSSLLSSGYLQSDCFVVCLLWVVSVCRRHKSCPMRQCGRGTGVRSRSCVFVISQNLGC